MPQKTDPLTGLATARESTPVRATPGGRGGRGKGEKAGQEPTALPATGGARKTSFGAKPSSRRLLAARRALRDGVLRVGCRRARVTAAPREMVVHDRTRLIDLPLFLV